MLDFNSEFIRQRVARYLWNRAEKSKDDNVRAIGFGIGIKDGEIDIERPFCVRAYVKKKKSKKAKWKPKMELRDSLKIPLEFLPEDSDQYGRKLQKATITIPTDVCEVPDLEGTARIAILDQDPSIVTTGAIVRFHIANDSRHRWGLLTVAHGYDRPASPMYGDDVSIVSPRTGQVFRGKRVQEFRAPSTGVDISLIRVDPRLLLQSGLISSIAAPAMTVRSYSQLSSDGGKAGTVFQSNGRAFACSILGTVDFESFQGVGRVTKLLHVSSARNVFVDGTSGSPFGVVNTAIGRLEAAALQIGSNPRTGYREGYGQSLETSLELLRIRLNQRLARSGRYLTSPIEVAGLF